MLPKQRLTTFLPPLSPTVVEFTNGFFRSGAPGRRTEPSRIYSAWYEDDMDREGTIKLTAKSLLVVVQTGAKNIEIAIMAPGKLIEVLPVEDIEGYVKNIE
jgi:20S proteasome subunit alpha 4